MHSSLKCCKETIRGYTGCNGCILGRCDLWTFCSPHSPRIPSLTLCSSWMYGTIHRRTLQKGLRFARHIVKVSTCTAEKSIKEIFLALYTTDIDKRQTRFLQYPLYWGHTFLFFIFCFFIFVYMSDWSFWALLLQSGSPVPHQHIVNWDVTWGFIFPLCLNDHFPTAVDLDPRIGWHDSEANSNRIAERLQKTLQY